MLTKSSVGTAAVTGTVMVAGLKLQLAFAGRPEQGNVTGPENPAAPVTLMGALTVCSALAVNVVFPLPSGARANAALTTWLSEINKARKRSRRRINVSCPSKFVPGHCQGSLGEGSTRHIGAHPLREFKVHPRHYAHFQSEPGSSRLFSGENRLHIYRKALN